MTKNRVAETIKKPVVDVNVFKSDDDNYLVVIEVKDNDFELAMTMTKEQYYWFAARVSMLVEGN